MRYLRGHFRHCGNVNSNVAQTFVTLYCNIGLTPMQCWWFNGKYILNVGEWSSKWWRRWYRGVDEGQIWICHMTNSCSKKDTPYYDYELASTQCSQLPAPFLNPEWEDDGIYETEKAQSDFVWQLGQGCDYLEVRKRNKSLMLDRNSANLHL